MEQKKETQWVPKKQEDPGLLARLSRPTGPGRCCPGYRYL